MLNFKKNINYKKLLEEHNFFDEKYYLKQYREARVSKLTAFEHFCEEGLEKGYRPNDTFDPVWYANYYSHLKNASIPPLVYFLTIGKDEKHFQNREEMVYHTLIEKSGFLESDFPQKSDINGLMETISHADEVHSLCLKAKENREIKFEKNDLNIVALLPDKIETENPASMLRLVIPLSLQILKEKIFFKTLPSGFDAYEIVSYDSCIVYANTLRTQEEVELLVDVLKNHKIELIVYVEREEHIELDATITYLLDHANVALFSTKALIERYPAKVKRKFILPPVTELELLDQEMLEFLALTWLQSIQKVNTIVNQSELFDKNFYLEENADLKRKSINPLWHYYWYGWREKRMPSSRFDIFWYAEEYFQDYLMPVNPVLHYEFIGKTRGFEIRPQFKGLSKRVDLVDNPKRITLFAAYDVDGIIDEYVILYIKELSKYSDVYFLSDTIVLQKELDKLSPYTKGAWAYRHGEYDFGSYKRLAQKHVGWETIEKYDELIFANDSSYLIDSLDKVFSKMSCKKTSFWGMQTTKGRYGTRMKASNNFSSKIPIEKIKKDYMESYFNEDEFDFHLGSYFLAFRSNIIKDKKFQKFMSHVSNERNKTTLIVKYEIGLTKFLIANEYDFETYMDDLYPYHPVYSNIVYDMIEEGFPFFKRLFIVLNHYKIKKIYDWKERLLSIHPSLDLKPIENNINRVGDATAVYKNIDVEKNDEKPFTLAQFVEEDKKSTVEKNLWLFVVESETHMLSQKSRNMFDKIKDDASIKKVILYRSRAIETEGVAIQTAPLHSRNGQNYLLKASKIFVGELLNLEIPFPLNIDKHQFVNLDRDTDLKGKR